ncbi:MAG: 2Fe-2S iron-sulfur cluster binding domain-containing protein [Ruminococcaceae bacterium]|nr:2Fe-2S iron-sulfur cluster binding domain-containing protein [Oscillospiraceae bacterium]
MDMVNVKINGADYSVPAGITVLEACKYANIDIPTLCYLKDINAIGACRLCLVEVKGARGLVAACIYPVNDGMEIQTNTPQIRAVRKTNLELVLSAHEKKCLSCPRSTSCELQKLAQEYHCDEDKFCYGTDKGKVTLDTSSPSIIRDNNKCILCRRCIAACDKLQGIGAIGMMNRGFDSTVAPFFGKELADSSCINCGQCIVACPVGALYEKDDTQKILDAIADPTKHVAICCAPSVRTAIGECFGYEPGTDAQGKMVAALKALGFDGVYDMNFTADLTIMEEATEFLGRVKNGGKLPLITSCSPGWVKYCEHYFPEMTENLSTCKSPQQMFGAMYKSYFAEKLGLDPKDIVFVSAIPCTAKKFEVGRDGQSNDGLANVDIAVTTRELGRMIEQAGIDFKSLEDADFDMPIEIGSGAGAIFGATGGVMEAALRTAAEVLEGKSFEKVDYEEVRGTEGIKFAAYKLGGMEVKVAVASGTANAAKLLKGVQDGTYDVQFIEIMACPGGCVNGGGQPIQPAVVRNNIDLRAVRASVLYNADAKLLTYRKSHENPIVKKVYEEFLGEPNSHKAHELLHTHYVKRGL